MKQKLTFEEKVTFCHDVEVEIENEEAQSNLDIELDENYESLEELLHVISGIPGVEITNVAQDESGQFSEIEFCDSCDL